MSDEVSRPRRNLWAEASLILAVLPIAAGVAAGYDMNVVASPEVGLLLMLCPFLAVFSGWIGRRRSRNGPREARIVANFGFGLGLLSFGCCLSYGYPMARVDARNAARRAQSINNLKQIGMALHMYHEAFGRFPPPVIRDRAGRPLYSWRVAILPFLEASSLFGEFHLDEPWDSPHNRELLARMPGPYTSPYPGSRIKGMTTYQGLVGPGTAFDAPDGTTLGVSDRNPTTGLLTSVTQLGGDFPDGADKSLMVVTARRAVPWSKPEDVLIQRGGPLPPLGEVGMRRREPFPGKIPGFIGLFADGRVRDFPLSTPESTLRALFSRNGGETISNDEY